MLPIQFFVLLQNESITINPLPPTEPLFTALDDRYSRQSSIRGWSQRLLSDSKVLVAGAGALGNEVLKNLALLGIGTAGIVDRDLVDVSNLSRSVLFRDEDLGYPKVLVAARGLREINQVMEIRPLHLDLTLNIGAGLLAEYDLVLGCLDSIEARWKLNRLCRSAGVAWVDAGIDASVGQIAFFSAARGPCYECGMTDSMWQRIHEHRSCMLAQQALPERQVATTAAMASLVAALQVQEAIAQLHRGSSKSAEAVQWPVLEAGDRLSVSVAPYGMSVLHGKAHQDCLAHVDESATTLELKARPREMMLERLLQESGAEMLELDWDVATELVCLSCGSEPCCMPAWALRAEVLSCPVCGKMRRPEWQSGFARGTELAHRTLAEFGVPVLSYLRLVTNEGHHLTVRLTGA